MADPTIVKLKASPGRRQVMYGEMNVGVDPDGTLSVPHYMVPDLIAGGCMMVEGMVPSDLDVRRELETCAAQHCSYFVLSRGASVMALDGEDLRRRALALYNAEQRS